MTEIYFESNVSIEKRKKEKFFGKKKRKKLTNQSSATWQIGSNKSS